jgi:outer membrane murein-binding lipoprotein Lpp
MHRIKKRKLLLAAFAGMLMLTGCGSTSKDEKAVAAFSSSISEFTSYLDSANEQINELDTTQKESCDELLDILDEMEIEFENLANLDVPDKYESVKTLAQGASKNMTQAVSYYHYFFEGDTYDSDDSETAYEYYMRAMLEVECIGYILANEDIPEGLLEDSGISLTVSGETTDANILNKWLGDDSSSDDEVIIENE